MDIRNRHRIASFTTKDGSEIRELLAHRNSCIANQSLAEARLLPGASTAAHYHPKKTGPETPEKTHHEVSSEAHHRVIFLLVQKFLVLRPNEFLQPNH